MTNPPDQPDPPAGYDLDPPPPPSPPPGVPPIVQGRLGFQRDTTSHAALMTGGVIDRDTACVECSFNLRGLKPDGRCPECGADIWRSVQEPWLIFSSADYLASLSRGIWCIIAAVLASLATAAIVLLGTAAAVAFAVQRANAGAPPGQLAGLEGTVEMIGLIVDLPIALLSLYGWWIFSARDPRTMTMSDEDNGQGPRLVVRITTVVAAVLALGGAVTGLYYLTSGQAMFEVMSISMAILQTVTSVVVFFGSMFYVGWLAQRMPSQTIYNRATQYLWLLPVIYIVGACLIVGPLVATILYFVFLFQVRREIEHIRIAQADRFGAPASPA